MLKLLNVDSDELTDADEKEAKPFPPEAFKAVTTAIDAARDKQFKAIWFLAAQTGFNMTDFARLKWGESILMNDKTPHVRLARIKKGRGKRCHPLAKETLKALTDYRGDLSPAASADGQFAFLNQGKINRNKPVSPNGIADSLETYRSQAGVSAEWTFKHLRNIGPNVRLRMKLPIDEEWAFLGHTQKLGEAQKYEFQEPERLSALVNAIAKDYFSKPSKPRKARRDDAVD
jgi:integrase